MARPRPKLNWETLATMPESVLLRTYDQIESERPFGEGIHTGGTTRQSLTARTGSLFRRGSQVCRSFVFRMGAQAGLGRQSRVTTYRDSYSRHELMQMLEGQRKIPSGLTEQMICKSIDLMCKREGTIRKNNKRAHDSYQRKLAEVN